MANIYAIYGKADCGKTKTLSEIRNLLRKKYTEAKETVLNEEDWGDFTVILTNVNGKKVGIESEGDPNSRLNESLKEFISQKCDIIFCPCRTKGMTVDWVETYKNGHNVEYIEKTKDENEQTQSATNKQQAKQVITFAGL